MSFVCKNPFSAWGKDYQPGQLVDHKEWKTDPSMAADAFATRVKNGDIVTSEELAVLEQERKEAEAEAQTKSKKK